MLLSSWVYIFIQGAQIFHRIVAVAVDPKVVWPKQQLQVARLEASDDLLLVFENFSGQIEIFHQPRFPFLNYLLG